MEELHHKKVLIIDDDPDLLELLGSLFSHAKADVQLASSGSEGLRIFYDQRPDLVILDLMMPEMSGWEVCRQIRNLSDVPLIMLTALQQPHDVTRGLSYGADDYVTKPFELNVLLARCQAVLRRASHRYHPETKSLTYSDDYLTIDLNKHRVRVHGKEVKLSSKEYQVLAYLLKNVGQVLTFQQILENGWGWEYQDHLEYVHAYIWRLRQKLEEDPQNPVYLLTEYGVGYRFEKPSPN